MAGDDFVQYLEPQPSGTRFVYTSAVHLPSMNHVLRAAYCIDDARLEGQAVQSCPKNASQWSSWWDVGPFKDYINAKKESQQGDDVKNFYRKYINPAHTSDEMVLFFPQGARFAVSKERILSRPKADYERLMGALSNDVDPYAGYYMEWLWSELFLGHQEPCALPVRVAPSTHAHALEDLALRFSDSIQRKLVGTESERLLAGDISGDISGLTTDSPPVVVTDVTKSIAVGDRSIQLADVEGINEGDSVIINPGTTPTETVTVKEVRPVTGRRLATPGDIIIDPPATEAFPLGTKVAVFAGTTTTSPTTSTTTTEEKAECFPGESMAVAPDHHGARLASLQIDDSALVAWVDGLGFEPVYGFLHAVEDGNLQASWRTATMAMRSRAASSAF